MPTGAITPPAELARVLELRQATSWAFAQKVLAALQRRRQAARLTRRAKPWTHVLLDATPKPNW